MFFVREKYVDIIQRFKSDCPDSELYLAAGEKVFEDYAAYKEAGLDGYVLFHRSADEDHFAKLHTIESYPDFRKRMLPILREAGLTDLRLIVNRVRRSILMGTRQTLDDAVDAIGARLIGYVPEDRHVLLASGAQKPLILSKNSRALDAFQRIAGRLDGESIPIPF